jgi:hypothetical protein
VCKVGQDIFETNILDNTFQNQETLPDQGTTASLSNLPHFIDKFFIVIQALFDLITCM